MPPFLIPSTLSPIFNNLKQKTHNLNPSKSLLNLLESVLFRNTWKDAKKKWFSTFIIAKKFNNFMKTHINGAHVRISNMGICVIQWDLIKRKKKKEFSFHVKKKPFSADHSHAMQNYFMKLWFC